MQGDCLSAIEFIVYLAQALTPELSITQTDHSYIINPVFHPLPSLPIPVLEHSYALAPIMDHNITHEQRQPPFEIDPKYADDISWISTSKDSIDNVKSTVPPLLKDANLTVNETKTEEFTIPQQSPDDPDWRNCKLLGSILDTENDITRRKGLLMAHMKSDRKIYQSKRLNIRHKIRYFVAFAESIFLYNCELWTLTSTMEKKLDAFHRKELRWALGIFWPRVVTNKQIYQMTQQEPWSTKIRRRRLSFLGHLCRLHPETPARKALEESLQPVKLKRGRPAMSWIRQVTEDLKRANINIDLKNPGETLQTLLDLTENRKLWQSICGSAMSGGLAAAADV